MNSSLKGRVVYSNPIDRKKLRFGMISGRQPAHHSRDWEYVFVATDTSFEFRGWNFTYHSSLYAYVSLP